PVRLQVNFEVEGFTILLGQSGEGKTTILRAIAGLLPADGEPFGGVAPQHRPVGYLPQGYALFPHLRAWENVAFALPRGPQRRAQALELLARAASCGAGRSCCGYERALHRTARHSDRGAFAGWMRAGGAAAWASQSVHGPRRGA